MDRILITGALGQLGNAFIDHFENKNVFILATDIKPLDRKLTCKYEKANVLDKERLEHLIKKYNINVIYHLVAVLSASGEKNPIKSWEINMNSFQNIIEVSLNNSIKQIFWPSSIAVFGTESQLDMVPQNPKLNPSTMYGITKLAGEKLMSYYNKKNDLDIRSLRYPGIVSVDTPPGGGTTDYIIEMINAAKKGKDYSCFLSENTELPMIHISDAVESALQLMSVPKDVLKIEYPYNITSFSITPKVLEKEIVSNGFSLKVTYNPDYRQKIAESWPRKIDDTQSKIDWKWTPKFDLEKTIYQALFN